MVRPLRTPHAAGLRWPPRYQMCIMYISCHIRCAQRTQTRIIIDHCDEEGGAFLSRGNPPLRWKEVHPPPPLLLESVSGYDVVIFIFWVFIYIYTHMHLYGCKCKMQMQIEAIIVTVIVTITVTR